eukprot:768573-Hanusia_phi.AAC.1
MAIRRGGAGQGGGGGGGGREGGRGDGGGRTKQAPENSRILSVTNKSLRGSRKRALEEAEEGEEKKVRLARGKAMEQELLGAGGEKSERKALRRSPRGKHGSLEDPGGAMPVQPAESKLSSTRKVKEKERSKRADQGKAREETQARDVDRMATINSMVQSLAVSKHPSREHEELLWQEGFKQVAGVDEAGRGPLAGPVVAAAVILPEGEEEVLRRVKDSKKMTEEEVDAISRLHALTTRGGSAKLASRS